MIFNAFTLLSYVLSKTDHLILFGFAKLEGEEEKEMGIKVIITEATGMIGKGVLLEYLNHPNVDHVITISRSALDLKHSKIIHADFSDYSGIEDQLKGYDACFLCMGISAAVMTEEKYTTITYEYTLAFANVLLRLNPEMALQRCWCFHHSRQLYILNRGCVSSPTTFDFCKWSERTQTMDCYS